MCSLEIRKCLSEKSGKYKTIKFNTLLSLLSLRDRGPSSFNFLGCILFCAKLFLKYFYSISQPFWVKYLVWSKLFSQDWKGNFSALPLKWQSDNSILLIYHGIRWLCQVISQYSFFRKSYIFPTLQISTESNSWFLFLACLSWFIFWRKFLISSQIAGKKQKNKNQQTNKKTVHWPAV